MLGAESSDLDHFNLGVLRRTVNDFHRPYRGRPTLKSLLRVLNEKHDCRGSKWALCKIVMKLGFRWMNATNNTRILFWKISLSDGDLIGIVSYL